MKTPKNDFGFTQEDIFHEARRLGCNDGEALRSLIEEETRRRQEDAEDAAAYDELPTEDEADQMPRFFQDGPDFYKPLGTDENGEPLFELLASYPEEIEDDLHSAGAAAARERFLREHPEYDDFPRHVGTRADYGESW